MENVIEKYETALNVLRTMLNKAGLTDGVKTTDYLLSELKAHKQLRELNIKAYAVIPKEDEDQQLWEHCEIMDMLMEWGNMCMKNRPPDMSNDVAEFFADKLKTKKTV